MAFTPDDIILSDYFCGVRDSLLAGNPLDPYSAFKKDFVQYDPLGVECLCNTAVVALSDKIGQVLDPLRAPTPPGLVLGIVHNIVDLEIHRRLDETFKALLALRNSLREHSWILFVGAGVSLESYFGNETVNSCVAQSCSGVGTIQQIREQCRLHGLNYKYWEHLRRSNQLLSFQQKLLRSVREKLENKTAPSEAHTVIAEWLEARRVAHLVCFNWDDFIEHGRGWPEVVGIAASASNSNRFWKPHGSVSGADDLWVYPDEPFRVHPIFIDSIKPSASPAHIVVNIGLRGGNNFNAQLIRDWMGNIDILDVRPIFHQDTDLGQLMSLGANYAVRWLKQATT